MFRLSVIFDPGAGPYAWIDVKKGEITLHPDILEVEGAADLRKSLAWLANIAPLVGATDIVCEIDITLTSSPAVLDVTFIKTETTGVSKETEMSATVKIMQKKKEEAAAKAAETSTENAAETSNAASDAASSAAEAASDIDPPMSSDEPAAEGEVAQEADSGTIEGDLPKEEPAAEKPKPAAKKTPTVTKAKPAAASTDLIAVTSNEIENLSEDKAVTQLKDLIDNQSFDAFRIGGILAKIQTEGWIGEHQNFRSFVEAEFDIKYRTAMMWIALYGDVLSSGVAWDKVKGLGWTKVAILASIMTPDNADSVLAAVDGMSVVAVRAYADNFDAPPSSSAASSAPAETETLKSKSFKLFSGQKETVDLALEKAKKESGTADDSAALDFICTDYMAGSKKATSSPPSIPQGALLFDPASPLDFDLVTAFKGVLDKSADLPEALNHILTALNEVAPKANIAVEIED